nr:MAG TPA: hypothetical protein [Caudoviricetes sp.]
MFHYECEITRCRLACHHAEIIRILSMDTEGYLCIGAFGML